MAVSTFGNSYGASSAGLSASVTGGQDIAHILQTQLAEQAKKRQVRAMPQTPPPTTAQPSLVNLFGGTNGG